jgi:hypothetical protein
MAHSPERGQARVKTFVRSAPPATCTGGRRAGADGAGGGRNICSIRPPNRRDAGMADGGWRRGGGPWGRDYMPGERNSLAGGKRLHCRRKRKRPKTETATLQPYRVVEKVAVSPGTQSWSQKKTATMNLLTWPFQTGTQSWSQKKTATKVAVFVAVLIEFGRFVKSRINRSGFLSPVNRGEIAGPRSAVSCRWALAVRWVRAVAQRPCQSL